jgi:hypothetical protein
VHRSMGKAFQIMFQIKCARCGHTDGRYGSEAEFQLERRFCSCCQGELVLTVAPPVESNSSWDSSSQDTATSSNVEIPVTAVTEGRSHFEPFSTGFPETDLPNDWPTPKKDERFREEQRPTAPVNERTFEDYREGRLPKYFDFQATDPDVLFRNRLKVVAEVPILRDTDQELSVLVQIPSQFSGVRFAVWLRRESEVGPGQNDYRFWSGGSGRAKLRIDNFVGSYELCIQPDMAKNWLWSIHIPVSRVDPNAQANKQIYIDLSRRAEGNAVLMEGYHNINISDHGANPVQVTTKTVDLELDIGPCKPRMRRAVVTCCPRRNRSVSEFTLQVHSREFGKETWNIHGGNSLAFGKDKPLPDRANHNDILFRPHRDETVWTQVSRTHGTFELVGNRIRYFHSTLGTNLSKKTVVKFASGKMTTVQQPNTVELADATELTRFWPRLSVDISESQMLQVQAWRAGDEDLRQYSWLPNSVTKSPTTSESKILYGGMRVDVVNARNEVLRQHFVISKSLTLGSSPSAQICCRGPGVEAFHAYIHWIDDHLWLEPYNRRCSIEVDGKSLHLDHLFPLERNVELVLGGQTKVEVLPFDSSAILTRYHRNA